MEGARVFGQIIVYLFVWVCITDLHDDPIPINANYITVQIPMITRYRYANSLIISVILIIIFTCLCCFGSAPKGLMAFVALLVIISCLFIYKLCYRKVMYFHRNGLTFSYVCCCCCKKRIIQIDYKNVLSVYVDTYNRNYTEYQDLKLIYNNGLIEDILVITDKGTTDIEVMHQIRAAIINHAR